MTNDKLSGRHVLVVEDEYFIAKELRIALSERGAAVIGPVSTLARAIQLTETAERIDGAILGVNLGGEMVSPLADLLRERGIPMLFATGYDTSALPARFHDVARSEKPADPARVLDTLSNLISERVAATS